MIYFQNGLNMKSSTVPVKISYIQCMLSTFNGKTIIKASALAPILLKSIEKAMSQPTVPPSVTEGICAAIFLLKLLNVEKEESSFQVLWNALLDMNKQVFVSENFLSSCEEESMFKVKLIYIYIVFYFSFCRDISLCWCHKCVQQSKNI